MFDHYIVASLAKEIQESLVGIRLQKIWSQNQQAFLLKFKSNAFFLIDLSPQKCHGRLVKSKIETQDLPQPFLLALRKNLEGAKLLDCQQIHNDRTLCLSFQGRTLTYDSVVYKLYLEFMGRHGNAIITDNENTILYAYKTTPFESQSNHIIRPGRNYEPLRHAKKDPTGSKESSEAILDYAGFYKKLIRLLPQDILAQSVGEIHQWISSSSDFRIYLDSEGDSIDFHQFNNDKKRSLSYPDLSTLLDAYYGSEKSKNKKLRHAKRILNNRLKVTEEKIDKLKDNLTKTEEAEKHKLMGELLLAYLHEIEGKSDQVELIDYYKNEPIIISLDPIKTPLENAQAYYKKYEKLIRSRPALKEQLSLAVKELFSLEQLLFDVEQVESNSEVDDIYEELEKMNLIQKQKRKKTIKISPRVFIYNNLRYEVGKNNKQNDEIRKKVKNKNFVWFHAKNIPGSHVVLHEEIHKASREDLLFGAKLASYYSKTKGELVTVDYTSLSKVKKPKSSAPGFVSYHGENQINVNAVAEEILPFEKK